jgi:hypothetical protein
MIRIRVDFPEPLIPARAALEGEGPAERRRLTLLRTSLSPKAAEIRLHCTCIGFFPEEKR